MEDLLLALLEPLFELALEFLLGALLEASIEVLLKVRHAVAGAYENWEQSGPVVSSFTLGFAGAMVGLISAFAIPRQVIGARAVFSGASLLLAPICAGIALKSLGNWVRRFGCQPSTLVTFRGGVVFAFTVALIRWSMIGRH
jgi:hypothetical protein